MIDDIQKEVEHQIKSSTWMDEDTRHFVLDKLVYMKNWIGYPDWYRNATLAKRFFQGVILFSKKKKETTNDSNYNL